MTFEERRRYIRVIKTASTDSRFKSEYDNFINEHRTLFQGTGSFAPHNAEIFLCRIVGFKMVKLRVKRKWHKLLNWYSTCNSKSLNNNLRTLQNVVK